MMTTAYGYDPRERLKELQAESATAAQQQRELDQGMGMLGYYLDMQGVASGRIGPSYPPTWRQRGAQPQKPAGLPDLEWGQATAAAAAREAAVYDQGQTHSQAEHDTADLPPLARGVRYQEATYQADRALAAADEALETAARRLARVFAAVEQLRQLEASAPARRAAVERSYQQQLAAIDGEVEQARRVCAALGI